MNKIDSLINYKADCETYRFGLSVLHAHIRLFECLLHISYRLDIKTWQVNIILYISIIYKCIN